MSKYPSDWLSKPLGKVYPKIVVGYVGNVNDHYCRAEEGVPFYRTLNIRDGYFRHSEHLYVTHEFNEKNKKSQITNNDILIARVGANLGMVCKANGISGLANMANAIIIKTKDVNSADADFYTYFLLSPMGKNQIYSGAAGGAQGVFNTKLTQEIIVPVPPLPEQRKIAKILSTWDKAIATTERLIATSQQQKKALMQQLLTGKKRLVNPDTGMVFEGDWEDKHLNEFSQVIVSPVDKKSIEGETPVALCNYTDVYYNMRITNKLSFMKATATQAEIKKFTLQIDDVVITKDSETPGDIAIPALVSEKLKGVVCGYHLAIVRTNKQLADGAFINYLFSIPKTRYYFFTLATGATRFGLSVDGINKAHFSLPSIKEQQKIASVLTATDKEIELIEAKLAHLKEEKKALMQQLLTGKRRVKVDAKEVA